MDGGHKKKNSPREAPVTIIVLDIVSEFSIVCLWLVYLGSEKLFLTNGTSDFSQ